MNKLALVVTLAGSLSAAALGIACTTTTTEVVNAPTDGGKDSSSEGGSSSGTSGSSGSDGGSSGTSGSSGSQDCSKTTTIGDCLTCCKAGQGSAYQKFLADGLACVCNGPGGGDAGTGPCVNECGQTCQGTAQPTSACETCLNKEINQGGACQAIGQACAQAPDCLAQNNCLVQNCQGKN